MNRRTLLLAASATLVLAGALPAAAQTIPSTIDEPVTITFYNYNLGSAGIGADATRKLIAEFMEANPNVTVEGIGAGAADFQARVQADLAAGQPVDLVQMVFSDLDFTANNFGAVALEDIVPADELDSHFEGMVPNGLDLGRLNGKTYSLAYTFSTPVLFYNADIFRAAGLDPDQPPRTWDEVLQTALAIQENTDKTGFAAGIFGPSAMDWLFQGVVRSNGGEVLSRDRTTLKFAEPEAVEAVQMLRDMYDAGAFDPLDITAALEGMSAGNIGMYLQTSAVQGAMVAGAQGNFELRASTMPSFGDKPVRPNNSGSGLTILAQDPLKQRAAWELMKFLTSEHGYTIITSEIGYLPLRPAIVDDPRYLKDWVEEHPLIQPNLDQLAILEPWDSMPGPNYRQIVSLMMDAAEMAVYGGVDVEATLADAQANAQALMP
ncbi:ABC transporter substrate-binding protein [Pelagibacterium halotolerans]|uniref:Glycerol-3-phosphate ABC transporter, periplasmic glycerol-3-phosphate-binding protein n=1 Tax=Pelagibacterium halotolerans (strain DSM 22347 / JCM 15775 / CGMCC 1.7692 / B2) TaxID=1082931 RepID=G4RCY0_PELHB|nr:ABC transporter substrate-binding protein [Pelagibacterium halotolerans]AEQ52763.1 glycerol-3-phosphate ABC transporter, periplasmic glycerol-3-phosphate-binding protein [Pelagibacterium halotolerans B2]QJR17541.1 ABC transporter substrate-binding protein [Pelagibacterium halotolerans]SEA76604.1 carbohydrate ABC transporter substrate-binding protein, CUT1 family [Pelagibacterium halotolerans]